MTTPPDNPRNLANCDVAIFIAYTLPPDAEARGYDDWLRRVDNPFFNSIPGVHQYTNWKITSLDRGTVNGWTHFDFLGLISRDDMDRVWFSPQLTEFRANWVKEWGPPVGNASEVFSHTYLLEAGSAVPHLPSDSVTVSFGTGTPPQPDASLTLSHTMRKHWVRDVADRSGHWLIPAAEYNPLGLDWVAFGDHGATATVANCARIAGVD